MLTDAEVAPRQGLLKVYIGKRSKDVERAYIDAFQRITLRTKLVSFFDIQRAEWATFDLESHAKSRFFG